MAKSKQQVIDQRRALLGSLLVRVPGITLNQLVDQIGGVLVNPKTGEPYTLTTIHGDKQTLVKRWREEAMADVESHVSRQFAEIQEVKKLGWQQKDGDLVLKALKRESQLLGLDAPQRHIHSGPDGGPIAQAIIIWKEQAQLAREGIQQLQDPHATLEEGDVIEGEATELTDGTDG